MTEDPRDAGRRIAVEMRDEVPVDPADSLANYAESARVDDWTLRSALVRFAQPEPTRASVVLHLVRRLDAALQPAVTAIAKRPALAEMARIVHTDPEALVPVVEGYEERIELSDAERGAIALLSVAWEFDALAVSLTEWAVEAAPPPPLGLIDASCAEVKARLDALGVPEEAPYGGGRGRGR